MIETKRLFIKPLTAEELKRHIDSPVDFAQDLGLIPSQSLIDNETKEAILNDLLPNITDISKDSDFYTMWILIEKVKKAIIGGICFHGEPNEMGEVEIGYGTDLTFRNKGYMTECISGMVHWLQENKDVKAIVAETENTNISSIIVLEKNDFRMIQQNNNSVIYKLEIKKGPDQK
ncbi:MAG TPA: GNAT family N-acetyltransferase [Bacteroidales bacterium]|nr:GNAT family N-acetyltransferase [Bacteroidales bacterium]